jgi:uncharacterized protein
LPEVICNTSPLQYLHQIAHLSLLESLAGRVLVPEGVLGELQQGVLQGINLPDITALSWIEIRTVPALSGAVLTPDLGPGETQVLAIGLQSTDPLLILDDAHARRAALKLGLPIRGTLGILLDAKQAGLIAAVRPLIERLQTLGFRLSDATLAAVLTLAGETSA